MANKYTRIANGTPCQKIAPRGLFAGLKSTLLRYCATFILLPLLALLVMVAPLLANSQTANAASNSTMNFQARLLLASGALVPDGFYSVEFKLYDSLSSGGTAQGVCSLNSSTDDCWWLETRTGANTIRVVNGYVAVNLGSVTPFGASIPWDQDLYVTMRVGGIGGPVWDATEMTNSGNRMKISAVTYAFRTAVLMNSTNTTGFNADQLVQLGPTATQAVSSAGAAINVNQTGAGTLLDLRAGGTSKLTVDASGNTLVLGATDVRGASLSVGTATVAGGLVLNDGSTNIGTLQPASLGQDVVYTLPDPGVGTATICLSTGNCGGTGDLSKVGNSFGSDIFVGTNDTFALTLRTDNQSRLTVLSGGNVGIGDTTPLALFTVGASDAFQINASGDVLTSGGLTVNGVSSVNGNLTIGNSSSDRLTITSQISDASPLVFQGATDNSFTTAISVTDPTANNTITLPDLSGTLALLENAQTFTGLKTFNAGITVATGQVMTINGDAFTDLTGTGLQITSGALNVIYGSAAGTAVQGNVAITCPSGSGNLSGGGTSITLGTGGTCANISTNNAVSFTASVTTPLLTSTGAISISSGGAGGISIDTAGSAAITIGSTNATSIAFGNASTTTTTINGTTLVLGTSTVRRSAAGTTTVELNHTADTTLNITNTDATAKANLTVEGAFTATSLTGSGSGITALDAGNVSTGTLGDSRLSGNVVVLSGTQTITGLKTFGAGATITTGQTLTVNGDAFTDLTGTGLVITSGALSIDTTYFNANYIQLGAASLQTDSSTNATIGVNKTGASGNLLTLQKNGAGVFVVGNSGALTIANTSTSALDIQTSGGTSTFTVDTSGNIVRVGASAADGTGVIFVLDTKNTAGDPTGTFGAQYYNSATGTFRCYENSRGWTDCLGSGKPNTRRTTQFLANGTAAIFNSAGGDVSTTTGTISAVAASSTAPIGPPMVNYVTANAANNDSGTSGNTNFNTIFNPSMQAHITLTTAVASTRSWVGFTNQTLATMDGAANPAGNYAAFRYDTSAGDVNWQCITKNGATQTITNSNIAASTNAVKMEIIIVDGVRVEFKINGTIVCTNTTNLPSTATLMRHVASRRNLVVGAQNIRLGWLYIDSSDL